MALFLSLTALATSAHADPADHVHSSNKLGDLDKLIECIGTRCTIQAALVDKALDDIDALASMGRFVPAMRDGKPNGFKAYAVRPNFLFSKLGMNNGDTVRQVNGNDLSTPEQALRLISERW